MDTEKQSLFAGLESGIITSTICIIITLFIAQQTLFPALYLDSDTEMNNMTDYMITAVIISIIMAGIFVGLLSGTIIGLISAELMTKKQMSLKKSTVYASLATIGAYLIYDFTQTLPSMKNMEIQHIITEFLISALIISIYIAIEGFIYYRLFRKKQETTI